MKVEGGWLRIASHLHMTLGECKARMPSSEYALWQVYLDELMNQHEKVDYYLAQIASILKTVNSKDDKQYGPEDSLLTFSRKDQVKQKRKRKRSRKKAAKESKAAWFAAVGLDREGKPKKNAPPLKTKLPSRPKKPDEVKK